MTVMDQVFKAQLQQSASSLPKSPCASQGCSLQKWCAWQKGRVSQRWPFSGLTTGPGAAHFPPTGGTHTNYQTWKNTQIKHDEHLRRLNMACLFTHQHMHINTTQTVITAHRILWHDSTDYSVH